MSPISTKLQHCFGITHHFLPSSHFPKMVALNMRKNLLTLLLVGILVGVISGYVKAQNCGCAANQCCSQYGYCGTRDAYSLQKIWPFGIDFLVPKNPNFIPINFLGRNPSVTPTVPRNPLQKVFWEKNGVLSQKCAFRTGRILSQNKFIVQTLWNRQLRILFERVSITKFKCV